MSRPSFQFYPDNYMNDACLRRCSKGTRGVWIDLLCLMHQGQPYGYLSGVGGKHPISFLARWCGETEKSFSRSLAELTANGVYSLTDTGVIYSRRMVRDEHNRIARGLGGVKSALHPNVPRSKGILPPDTEGILCTGEGEGEGEAFSRRRLKYSSEKENLFKDDDDDKNTWASEKDELAALVLAVTGSHADRKLLDSVVCELEGRDQPLRDYLDDIGPRFKRLKDNPGPGFFLSHARSFGGYQQQRIAPSRAAGACGCKWGTRGDGSYCVECETGRELQRAEERIAADKAKAAVQ